MRHVQNRHLYSQAKEFSHEFILSMFLELRIWNLEKKKHFITAFSRTFSRSDTPPENDLEANVLLIENGSNPKE